MRLEDKVRLKFVYFVLLFLLDFLLSFSIVYLLFHTKAINEVRSHKKLEIVQKGRINNLYG